MSAGGFALLSQAVPVPALASDQVVAFVLLDIVIILAVARLVGALFLRLGQPRVVGEIVAGVLLGPTLLGATLFEWGSPPAFLHCADSLAATGATQSITSCLFPPQSASVLGVLGQLGLTLFMFLVGLELDFGLTKGKEKSVATVAVGVVAIPVALGFLIGPALYNSRFVGNFGTADQPSALAFSIMVGGMLSVTAFPVMARILQEKGLTRTTMGSIGVSAAAVASVLMFLVIGTGAAIAVDATLGSVLIKYLLTGLFVAVMVFAVPPLLAPLGRKYEQTLTLSGTMFAVVLLLVFASAYIADRLGLTVIVGAFLAGAVMPSRPGLFMEFSRRLTDLTAIVLLPIFLAFSGLRTDFTTLRPEHLAGLALFLVAGVVGKWGGGAVAARLGGLSWAEGNVIGILMNCRGLLILVAAIIAFNRGVISPQMQVAAVLMALITTMMTGPLFDRYIGRATATPVADADGLDLRPAQPSLAAESPEHR